MIHTSWTKKSDFLRSEVPFFYLGIKMTIEIKEIRIKTDEEYGEAPYCTKCGNLKECPDANTEPCKSCIYNPNTPAVLRDQRKPL